MRRSIVPTAALDQVITDLQAALGAHRWDDAVNVIGVHWSLLLDEAVDLLDDALRTIPAGSFAADQRAAAVRDIRLHSYADAVDRVLGAAGFPAPDDLGQLDAIARSTGALNLLSVAASRMIALRIRGEFSRAARLAPLVERFGRLSVVHQPALIEERLPAALLQSGITRGLADDLPGALVTLRDAYERAPHARAAYVERDAAGKAALFLALSGDIDHARRWIRRYDRAPEAHGWYAPRIALTANAARALIAVESLARDDAVAAVSALDEPVNVEQSWGPVVSFVRARDALAWGDRQEALREVRADQVRYSAWLAERSTMGPLLLRAEADLLLALGRVRQAAVALRGGPDHPLTDIARARVSLLSGDLDRARRLVGRRAEVPSTRALVDALVTRGLVDGSRDAGDSASAVCSDLIATLRQRGLLLPVLAIPAAHRLALEPLLPPGHGARDTVPGTTSPVRITAQQQLILEELEKDLSIREIAASLHLSVNTVKTHARVLYRKLDASTRDEVIARAYEVGLL